MSDARLDPPQSRVKVEHVSKRYCKDLRRSLWYGVQDIIGELNVLRPETPVELRPAEFWALRDVSFEVREGEALAVIGANGAGKSSLLKLINGLIKPDAGRIAVSGRVGALIELGTGFNPSLTGRENIYLNAAVLGLPRAQTAQLVETIVDFAELEDFIDAPLQDYSSGMWVRLGYAIAAHLRPDVLLADEVLAVGDVRFHRKCIQHVLAYIRGGGTLILVSHNPYLAQVVCSRCIVLDGGRIVFEGPTIEGFKHYIDSQVAAERPASIDGAGRAPTANGPVTIESVELLPAAGDRLQSGEPARVVVNYHASEDTRAINWGFSFWTPDLAILIAGAHTNCGSRFLRRGSGRLTCQLPSLVLNSGAYAMRAFINEAETGLAIATLGWQEPPTFVIVDAEVSAMNNNLSMANMLVKLEPIWE
jgi:lipopolysaccharide transport system ATP-binding protein